MKPIKSTFALVAAATAFIPLVTLAQDGTLGRLTALPFVSQGAGIGELIYGLFLLSISVAGIFAVVKLVIAGLKYMTSDVASTKQSAIGDIKGAVLGLVLLLAAIIILDAINPDIANTKIALPELPSPEISDPSDETFKSICSDLGAGDNCSQVTCETFDSSNLGDYLGTFGTVVGWIPQVLGADYALNVGSCAAKCQYLGGTRNSELFDSGTCIYPKDPAAAAQNVLRETTEDLSEKLGIDVDIAGGERLVPCQIQGGPLRCQSERENCTAGRLVESDSGIESVENSDGTRVVRCTPVD